MKTRTSLVALSAAVALALPGLAFADHDYPEQMSHSFGPIEVMKSEGTMTRAEVLAELEAFRANPISADGWYRYVGGDVGWVARNNTDRQSVTRAEVLEELAAFREHPVSGDGRFHYVGGNAGWIRDYDEHTRTN